MHDFLLRFCPRWSYPLLWRGASDGGSVQKYFHIYSSQSWQVQQSLKETPSTSQDIQEFSLKFMPESPQKHPALAIHQNRSLGTPSSFSKPPGTCVSPRQPGINRAECWPPWVRPLGVSLCCSPSVAGRPGRDQPCGALGVYGALYGALWCPMVPYTAYPGHPGPRSNRQIRQAFDVPPAKVPGWAICGPLDSLGCQRLAVSAVADKGMNEILEVAEVARSEATVFLVFFAPPLTLKFKALIQRSCV